MLPPVRATLSSSVEYHSPQQQPLLRQTINTAGTTANAATNTSMPISGGRLDILSLSAQLQLAQGFSIFAETIGKLVKLPRREGEALLDYAKRLMEAVKAMSPAQQASLERMLNQLVKGISLRLLTDILNNPSGPDAARLAVRLETAQLLERDLAAKAVVSSYRQNGGAEPAPAAPLPAPPPQRPAAATNATAVNNPAETAPSSQSETAAVLQETATSGDGGPEMPEQASAAADPASHPGLQGHKLPAGEALIQPAQAQSADVEALIAQAGEQENVPSEVIAGSVTEEAMIVELAESETAEVFAPVIDELPENHAGRATVDDADVWGPASNLQNDRRAPAAGFYDGPALARLSQRGLEEQPVRQSANAGKMGMPAMTEWLAEVLAEGGTDLLEPLPATAKMLPEQQVLEELFDKDAFLKAKIPADDPGKAILQTPKGYPSEEPEVLAPQSRPGSASANGSGQPANITDAAEQLVLPLPLPLIPREGVALPYVAYPPEERERDPEERKTKAIAPTDEDGEQQHGAGDQQFAEDHPHDEQAEEEKADAAAQQAEEQAEDSGRANDLYWRMAGWN